MTPEIYFSSNLTLYSKNNVLNKNLDIEEISIYRENHFTDNSSVKHNDFSIFKNIKLIIKEKVFLFSALALANLFFIITAVQYWAPDYLTDVLLVKNPDQVTLSFIVVCITSPTLGVIFGGILTSRIGGYESKHSILLCLIFGILAAASSIPVPLVDHIVPFTVYLWLLLFFGGAIVPTITGIIISSLPLTLRGSANSITCIFCSLLGYMPAPFVYGSIYEATKYSNDRTGFMCVMYYSLVGVILLALACYFRYQRFNKNKNFISLIDTKIKEHTYIGSVAMAFGSYMNVDTESFYETEIDDCEKYQYQVFNQDNNEQNQRDSSYTPQFNFDFEKKDIQSFHSENNSTAGENGNSKKNEEFFSYIHTFNDKFASTSLKSDDRFNSL
jgi:hypothetical protein